MSVLRYLTGTTKLLQTHNVPIQHTARTAFGNPLKQMVDEGVLPVGAPLVCGSVTGILQTLASCRPVYRALPSQLLCSSCISCCGLGLRTHAATAAGTQVANYHNTKYNGRRVNCVHAVIRKLQ